MSEEEIQGQEETIADGADGAEEVTATEGSDEVISSEQVTVKIGDREFGSHAEALAWAEQNMNQGDAAEAKLDAYRRGLEEAQRFMQPQNPVTASPEQQDSEDDLEWETKFYENPKKALLEIKEQTAKELRESLRREQEAEAAEQNAWSRFRELNPDLAGQEKVARLMMTEYADELKQRASALGQDEAIKFLGQKTRALFQAYSKDSLPREVLPEGGATVLSGEAAPVTKVKKEETQLSFTEQIRSLNKGRPTGV